MQFQGQWADTLLAAERAQVLQLATWALLSLSAGLATGVALRLRRARKAPLLFHFAAQTAAWGAAQGVLAAWWWAGLALRDLASAVALERLAHLALVFDAGLLVVAVTLLIAGWTGGRRDALMGAAAGVTVQAAARLLLDAQLAAIVVR